MRNDLQEAKQCLERACPLMELLPAAIEDSFDRSEAFGHYFFDSQELSEDLDINSNGGSTAGELGGQYAANCFALLRNVYLKLYDHKLQPPSPNTGSTSTAYRDIDNRKQTDDQVDVEDEDYADALFHDLHPEEISDEIEDETVDSNNGNDKENIDEKIEQLRLPFQHLRSELLYVHKKENDVEEGLAISYAEITESASSDVDDEDVYVDEEGEVIDRRKEWQLNSPSSQHRSHLTDRTIADTTTSTANTDTSNDVGISSSTPSTTSSTGPGPSSSIIATDLEIMLRKFVKEDESGRREILRLARSYYDNLDINFPFVSINIVRLLQSNNICCTYVDGL
jgi:hypothetical protein